MKILFAASKEMNLDDLIKRENNINFKESYKIISFIKDINISDCCTVFKTKENIYQMNQDINIYSKTAISLYNGISFRQLKDRTNEKYKDVLILSALYGFSYAFDYISPYRYDYTMKYSKENRKIIYQKINDILKDEDVILNLASNEFSNGIKHDNLINFTFYHLKGIELKQQSVASKKLRGQMINYIFENGYENLAMFTYDGYNFSDKHSDEKNYVYIKKEQ